MLISLDFFLFLFPEKLSWNSCIEVVFGDWFTAIWRSERWRCIFSRWSFLPNLNVLFFRSFSLLRLLIFNKSSFLFKSFSFKFFLGFLLKFLAFCQVLQIIFYYFLFFFIFLSLLISQFLILHLYILSISPLLLKLLSLYLLFFLLLFTLSLFHLLFEKVFHLLLLLLPMLKITYFTRCSFVV